MEEVKEKLNTDVRLNKLKGFEWRAGGKEIIEII